jgi:hypothetical protein
VFGIARGGDSHSHAEADFFILNGECCGKGTNEFVGNGLTVVDRSDQRHQELVAAKAGHQAAAAYARLQSLGR